VELVNRLRADGVPAVISGAGPTVLALTEVSSRPARISQDSVGDRIPGLLLLLNPRVRRSAFARPPRGRSRPGSTGWHPPG
ncbi:hypothetical protein AB0B51_16100, partial [Streptomyces griseus]